MRVNYQILSLALILCIAFLLMRDGVDISPSQVVLNNIHTRTSIRDYSSEKVSEATLKELVKAAMAAPTAGNMQPWNFLAITDKMLLEEISQIHKFTNPLKNATAAIIVTADMNTYAKRQDWESFWVTDTSVCSQNILLAAHSMGLGAVWLSVYPFEAQNKNLRRIIDIPANTNILCIISLGYPKEEIAPKNKFKEEKFHLESF